MRPPVSAPEPPRLSAVRAVVYGALTVGILDLADAFVFFGLQGVAPIRILQGIAAGILGRASFQGGAGSASLGILLHFFIASLIVATFHAVSRALPLLTRHAVVAGVLYGLAVYVVMNKIVVPLSAAGAGAPSWPVVVNGLAIHAFGVGLPTALFARAAAPPRAARRVTGGSA